MPKRRSSSSRSNRTTNSRGQIGFFEDLPSLLVVLIGICIFIASAINTLTKFTTYQAHEEIPETCWEFMLTLRAWEGLVCTGYTEGVFDGVKIQTLTIEKLREAFPVVFDYKIEIIDISGYPNAELYNHVNQTADIPPAETTKYGIQVEESPIVIIVSDTEAHAGRLIVTVWET